MEISVIVPAYNVGCYIDRCLNSLVNQRVIFGGGYEVIVINDGSTDNTLSRLNDWAAKFPALIKVYNKRNGGLSSARNLGLDNAKGRLITFVDSDDYVSENYLQGLYSEMCEANADISVCAINRCAGDDGKGKRFFGWVDDTVCSDIDYVLKRMSFSAWGKLYKAELFEGMRFPEGMTYEDFALIPQIFNKAKVFAYTHRVLYHYYINLNSIIMSKLHTTNRDILKAQHILELSDLQSKPDVLENLYIRRVLESMCYSLVLHDEDKTLVHSLVDEAYAKYPNIKKNEYFSQVSFHKRVFFYLLLKNNYCLSRIWVCSYNNLANVIKKIIVKCQISRL